MNRIKKLRHERKMTQSELGEKVGVTKATICKYEGESVINIKRSIIAKLVQALDTTPGYLMHLSLPWAKKKQVF